MSVFCKLKQDIRYWLFPKSKLIDERTLEIDQHREAFKKTKAITDQIVANTNRPDVLRNIVIAMQNDFSEGRHGQITSAPDS